VPSPNAAQVLSTRARKDVSLDSIKVDVCIFAFDCLYLNGRTLLREPLTERRAALHSALNTRPGLLELATAKVCICVYIWARLGL
jgi:DNA ligase-1